ncbi:MAG: zinc-dependent metalloprotease [Alistipes senegalensis]
MIRLHKVKGKLYFEFPVALLGRDMLLGSTVSEISDNGDAVIGSKPTDPLWIQFTRTGDKVQVRKLVRDNVTDAASPNIARSLANNNIGAIIKSYDIAAWSPDSCAVVFNATDLFLSDNKALTPFDPYGENLYYGRVTRSASYQSDKSFLGEIRAFEDNVVIRSHLSYTYTLKAGSKEIASDVPFTAVMTRSLVLLPETPYEPRFVDSRMSVLPPGRFFSASGSSRPSCSATPTAGASSRRTRRPTAAGSSSGPRNRSSSTSTPISPRAGASPFSKPSSRNEPFERIGFEQAVEAREFPKDDPEFDPDNIKYSCIRYAPIGISNAMGPSWVDPRSGEIVNASVYVFHDIVKLVNNWRFIQTAQADKSVRSVKLPREVMDDALRYVVTHEVGHCLGFMHNMSASAVIPVDSLRSPSFTQKYGTTTSIMDYARFNYVAQPGDMERGVRMTPPRFGVYDYYAVKWLYTPVFDAASPEEVYKITSRWITEAAADPVLRYGKQQGAVLDPPLADRGPRRRRREGVGVRHP